MEFNLEHAGERLKLAVEGGLTIEHAAKLKEVLVDSLGRKKSLVVNVEGLSDIDLSCIQLFCSANRTFEMNKKELSLEGHNTEIIADAVLEAGYDRDTGCPESPCVKCLWRHRED